MYFDKMMSFRKLFRDKKCAVIGMVHVGALPGTPLYAGNTIKVIEDAVRDAKIYKHCKVDGILVENMNDIPYVRSKDISPETISMMTRICGHVRRKFHPKVPCGVQILAGCNREAIAVAQASNFQFIRAEGFVFSHIADEGLTDACAGPLLRYRKRINADNVLVLADIKKKHSSHAITYDVSLSETAKAAEFFLADGVIVTGTATGDPVDAEELAEVKDVAKGPVIVGSGVTIDNIEEYISADAVIVGSHFKVDGLWQNAVDEEKVTKFMTKIEELRKSIET